MTESLRRAVAELTRLPGAKQDRIAARLLEELDEREWDSLLARPESDVLLERLAEEALASERRGETRPLEEST